MASSMIHYAISKEISERIKIDDVERFLFGATIVPDASSHEDGSYDQAHFQGWLSDSSKKGIDYNRFEEEYFVKFAEDSIYLGYWCHLLEDAIWVHDVADKFIRVHPRDIRKEYYQKSYSDYVKLNYLLKKEYGLEVPEFLNREIPISEVRKDLVEPVLTTVLTYFEVTPCEKSDLELYTWDVITEYINKCVEFCVKEINDMKEGRKRMNSEMFYVTA